MWRRVCAERPKLAAAHAGGGGGGGAEDVFESALARVVRPASLRPCVPALIGATTGGVIHGSGLCG
jgi:urease alpha subunit